MVPGFGVLAECQSIGSSGKKSRACYLAPKTLSLCIFLAFVPRLCFPYSSFQQVRQPSIPPRLKKAKSNFFTNRNILRTLKKEPLNIMLLHTSRTMDGPSIKTVPVVSRIFDVSSSTGLKIEGCRTCWEDE